MGRPVSVEKQTCKLRSLWRNNWRFGTWVYNKRSHLGFSQEQFVVKNATTYDCTQSMHYFLHWCGLPLSMLSLCFYYDLYGSTIVLLIIMPRFLAQKSELWTISGVGHFTLFEFSSLSVTQNSFDGVIDDIIDADERNDVKNFCTQLWGCVVRHKLLVCSIPWLSSPYRCLVEKNVPIALILPSRRQYGAESLGIKGA